MVTGINRNRPYVNIALVADNVAALLYVAATGRTEAGELLV